ncbi:hypothetical protein MMC21_002457 [Puttea exsequens]|nr:hypothetical protein [Puttea exsequens]
MAITVPPLSEDGKTEDEALHSDFSHEEPVDIDSTLNVMVTDDGILSESSFAQALNTVPLSLNASAVNPLERLLLYIRKPERKTDNNSPQRGKCESQHCHLHMSVCFGAGICEKICPAFLMYFSSDGGYVEDGEEKSD